MEVGPDALVAVRRRSDRFEVAAVFRVVRELVEFFKGGLREVECAPVGNLSGDLTHDVDHIRLCDRGDIAVGRVAVFVDGLDEKPGRRIAVSVEEGETVLVLAAQPRPFRRIDGTWNRDRVRPEHPQFG